MNIQLPVDQQTAIEAMISNGRFASIEEAVVEGIKLLVSSEKLRQAVQTGIEQAETGDLHDHDTVFSHLRKIATKASN